MTIEFSAKSRNDLQDEELRRQLLERVEDEKAELFKLAEDFYGQTQRPKESCLAYCKKIIVAIDRILAEGDWESSLFLRNTIKPLKKMQEEALQLQNEILGSAVSSNGQVVPAFAEDKMPLYVSLFQSQGHDLRQWELQLSSISSYMLGRPVYQHEEEVLKVMRQKLSQASEAYVVVEVKPGDIQDHRFQAPRLDRHGNRLISLAEGAVAPENIIEFVYQGRRYCFHKGKLVAQQVKQALFSQRPEREVV